MLDVALGLAEEGLFVFPCRARDEVVRGTPCKAKAPLTSNGFLAATRNRDQIERWWREWPDALVGIVPGHSNLVAFDVDSDAAEQRAADLGLLAEPTATTLTPSRLNGFPRARHLMFRVPPQVTLEENRLPLIARHRRGFVIVAGLIEGRGNYVPFDASELRDLPAAALVALTTPEARPVSSPVSEAGPVVEGGRNILLTSLAGSMRRPGMTAAEIRASIAAVNNARCHPPLDEHELDTIAQSVGSYRANATAVAATTDTLPEVLPCTDAGNAQRFVRQHRDNLLHVPTVGWLHWDGRRYAPCEADALLPLAMEVVAAMLADALAMPGDSEERVRALRWAAASHSAGRHQAMLTLAAGFMRVDRQTLDANPWLLTCANGTIDLRDGTLRPHSRADRITKMSPATYDPDATDAKWQNFLHTLWGHDPDLLAFLQRAIGYSFTGSTQEEVLFFVYCPGNGGKTTLLETLAAVLGDAAMSTPVASLMERRVDAPSNDVARLAGARMVRSMEASERARLDAARLKALSGGDRQAARFLFREAFEFTPVFKLWLGSNFKPKVDADDTGLWRRLRVIPCVKTVPPDQQDKTLKVYLSTTAAASAAVLAWVVTGARTWYQHDLGWCDAVRQATDEYRTESDVLGEWQTECADASDREALTPFGVLYRSYTDWCRDRRERPVSQRGFAAQLTARGFADVGNSTVATRRGLRLPVGEGPGRDWQ